MKEVCYIESVDGIEDFEKLSKVLCFSINVIQIFRSLCCSYVIGKERIIEKYHKFSYLNFISPLLIIRTG